MSSHRSSSRSSAFRGIGKSRLVFEFFGAVAAKPDTYFWRQGRCLPYGQGVNLWAIGEIVKAHAGILEDDGREQTADKLARAVRAAVPAAEVDWTRGAPPRPRRARQ